MLNGSSEKDGRYTKVRIVRKIARIKVSKKIRIWIGKDEEIYKKEWIKGTKGGLETMVQFRMRNETEAEKHWLKNEEKICRICKKEEEVIEHMLEICKVTDNAKRSCIEQMKEGRKTLVTLKRIKWLRKEKEKGKSKEREIE